MLVQVDQMEGEPPMSIKRPSPHDIAIGRNVRGLRHLQKMSQETLGKHIGLTFQQVQKYEKGVNRISGSRLIQIAKLFNVGVAEICNVPDGASGNGNREDVMTQLAASRVGVELAEHFVSIKSSKVQRAAADLVATLAALANGQHQNGD